MSLLEVNNLTVTDTRTKEVIVSNVSFTVNMNSCLGIIGESGSGKSMMSKALLGLINPWLQVTGSVYFYDLDLIQTKGEAIRKIRGSRICMIPQDAMSAFHPLNTIGSQMVETLRENLGISKKEAENMSIVEVEKMCINEPALVFKKYPHQLSGGMLQRCMLAIAMAMKPDIIIADEPTTALDAINRREVVAQFQRIREEFGTAIVFISHDLGIVQQLAQHVLVMKDGTDVEYGEVEEVFSNPKHEYTKYLLNMSLQLTGTFTKAMRKDALLCLK